MIFRRTTLIIWGITFLLSCTNEKIIELPITEKIGYGSFQVGFRGLTPYSGNKDYEKTYLKISGIPKDWTDLKLGHITTNAYQSLYQDYLHRNISKEKYEYFQKVWGWIPDTLTLSKEPVKCKIAFASGKDSSGEFKLIVDSNNNYDLSDDKIIKSADMNLFKLGNVDSLAQEYSINVKYERFINDKIVEVSSPLLFVHKSQSNRFLYNFPQYYTATLYSKDIAISSTTFTDLSYHYPSFVLLNDSHVEGEKVDSKSILSKNEYLEIKGILYKILSVNMHKNILILEKTNLPKNQLYSTQVGFKSFPFEGKDFKTKSSISMNNLKGKYVLLDFWAVWCGPCIHEIPNLKQLHEKIDKSKFEIIGVVGSSTPDALEKMINQDSITWPQILSNDSNNIIEDYGIHSYPTTFLLNPQGTIIAKDLRGKELENKVLSLITER